MIPVEVSRRVPVINASFLGDRYREREKEDAGDSFISAPGLEIVTVYERGEKNIKKYCNFPKRY